MKNFKSELNNVWSALMVDTKGLSKDLQMQLKRIQARSIFLIEAYTNNEIGIMEYRIEVNKLDKDSQKLMTRLLAESTSLTSV